MRILEVPSIVRSWSRTWMEIICFQNSLFWMHSHFGGREGADGWIRTCASSFLMPGIQCIHAVKEWTLRRTEWRLKEHTKPPHNMVPGKSLKATVLSNWKLPSEVMLTSEYLLHCRPGVGEIGLLLLPSGAVLLERVAGRLDHSPQQKACQDVGFLASPVFLLQLCQMQPVCWLDATPWSSLENCFKFPDPVIGGSQSSSFFASNCVIYSFPNIAELALS